MLEPDEGFDLSFHVKTIGESIMLSKQRMRFRYADMFGPFPDAYEELLLEVIKGDQTLFVSSEWVEESWKLYEELLKKKLPIYPYATGTWGPQEANTLIAKTGNMWKNP
jgi:glucose-6-phosphate 1-dehydrogenase